MEPLQSHATFRGIWVFAAVVAVSLHVALGAYALTHLQDAEDVDLGAPGIEIGLELAAPRVAPSDLPPGPDSEASMASSPALQQQVEVKESELPDEVPTETADPDRLVSPNSTETPQEEQPEVKAQPALPSEASVAQEATATPTIETAQEAPQSITRDPGTGQSKQRVRSTWQRELIAHLDKHKRYPADQSRKNVNILINLVLDRGGRIISARISKSSGDSAFDEAALAMVRRADPVPAPPALIADDGLTFALPVNFRVKARASRLTGPRPDAPTSRPFQPDPARGRRSQRQGHATAFLRDAPAVRQ